jgi:hypothetical protein
MPSERVSERAWFDEEGKKPPSSTTGLPHDNRRKHARFQVDGTNVSLYREGLFTALGLGRSNKGRSALDISESGARVLITEKLNPQTKVRLRIEIERYKDSIEVEGEVCWCRPTAKAVAFQAGIRFSSADPSLRRKIGLMHDWFSSPQYKALRDKRNRGERSV